MSPRDEGCAVVLVKPPGFGAGAVHEGIRVRRPVKSDAGTVISSPNIQALTRAARHGDEEAFSRLYDLYSFRVYKFLLVLSRGNEHQAREVCQAVFIKLAKRWEVFDEEQRLWAWLCVLTKNTFIDHCRANRRSDRLVPWDQWSSKPDNRTKTEGRLAELVREALADLPPEERELIQTAYIDKRSLGELAREAGQSYKALESRLGRIRRKLKDTLLRNLRHENEL